MSLFDYEEKTAKQLERIGDTLENHFKEPEHQLPPPTARNFSDIIKQYFATLDSASELLQERTKAAEIYRGSEFYNQTVQGAQNEFEETRRTAGDTAKRAIQLAIGEMKANHSALTKKSVPSDILQQIQLFSLLKNPTAAQYQHYQEIFRDYPSAMEILINKYDTEAKPVTERGKNEYGMTTDLVTRPGYTPKYPSGALFVPERPMDAAQVENYFDRLERNANYLLGEVSPDNIIARAQISNIRESETPVEVLSNVALSNDDSETELFLQQIDPSYRPSKVHAEQEKAAPQAPQTIGKPFTDEDAQHVRDYYAVGNRPAENPDGQPAQK